MDLLKQFSRKRGHARFRMFQQDFHGLAEMLGRGDGISLFLVQLPSSSNIGTDEGSTLRYSAMRDSAMA